jgi:hypothetical protein
MGCTLDAQPVARVLVGEREKADMTWTRTRYNQTTTRTSLSVNPYLSFPFVRQYYLSFLFPNVGGTALSFAHCVAHASMENLIFSGE